MWITKFVNSLFDIKKLVGVDRISKQTSDIKDMAKEMFTPETAKRTETFEEAQDRLQLSEEDIKHRQFEFKRLIFIFSWLAVLLGIYLVYLLLTRSWIASAGCFGILLVIIGQLFRYQFWLFQIQQRRLGCTFREWFNSMVGSKP